MSKIALEIPQAATVIFNEVNASDISAMGLSWRRIELSTVYGNVFIMSEDKTASSDRTGQNPSQELHEKFNKAVADVSRSGQILTKFPRIEHDQVGYSELWINENHITALKYADAESFGQEVTIHLRGGAKFSRQKKSSLDETFSRLDVCVDNGSFVKLVSGLDDADFGRMLTYLSLDNIGKVDASFYKSWARLQISMTSFQEEDGFSREYIDLKPFPLPEEKIPVDMTERQWIRNRTYENVIAFRDKLKMLGPNIVFTSKGEGQEFSPI